MLENIKELPAINELLDSPIIVVSRQNQKINELVAAVNSLIDNITAQ